MNKVYIVTGDFGSSTDYSWVVCAFDTQIAAALHRARLNLLFEKCRSFDPVDALQIMSEFDPAFTFPPYYSNVTVLYNVKEIELINLYESCGYVFKSISDHNSVFLYESLPQSKALLAEIEKLK